MKVAFFDLAFHKKTNSGDFLRNIIQESSYEIDNYWDDEIINYENFSKDKYAFAFFFQFLPPASLLRKISVPIVWAPMLDSILNTPDYTYFRYLPLRIKVLSFSRHVTNRFKRLGFETLETRYYIKPSSNIRSSSSNCVFLWQRRNVDYNTLKNIFNFEQIRRIILLVNPDPGFRSVYPTKNEIKIHKISMISGHKNRGEYYKILEKCNIFVCPRRYEGIGMSFLEAISMGKLVISEDYPTMNEYIKNGRNGILYSGTEKIDVNIKRVNKLISESLRNCEDGYDKWIRQRPILVKYFVKKGNKIGMCQYIAFIKVIIEEKIFKSTVYEFR